MKSKRIFRNVVAVSALLLICSSIHATQIEINAVGVDGGVKGNTPDISRGISFRADSAFSITSVGLFSDIGSTSYDVNIHSSTDGHQLTGLLASTTATVGGSGLQWYDIPIDYAFAAGSYYGIEWETTSGNTIPGGTGDYFHYGLDSYLPLAAGPVTLIDGFMGSDFDNLDHPRLRIDVVESVPEPGVLVLMGLGLAGLGYLRRKQIKAA